MRIVAESGRDVVLARDVGGREHRDDARRTPARRKDRGRRAGRAPSGEVPIATCSVPSGSRMSSMYCAVPWTCLEAESCGSGAVDMAQDVRASCLTVTFIASLRCLEGFAAADDPRRARVAGGDLDQRLEQQIARDGGAVARPRRAGRSAAGSRRASAARRAPRTPARRARRRQAPPRSRSRPLRRARHAAEGDARCAMRRPSSVNLNAPSTAEMSSSKRFETL